MNKSLTNKYSCIEDDNGKSKNYDSTVTQDVYFHNNKLYDSKTNSSIPTLYMIGSKDFFVSDLSICSSESPNTDDASSKASTTLILDNLTCNLKSNLLNIKGKKYRYS